MQVCIYVIIIIGTNIGIFCHYKFLLLYYNFYGHVIAKVVLVMTLCDLGGYLYLKEPVASYSP